MVIAMFRKVLRIISSYYARIPAVIFFTDAMNPPVPLDIVSGGGRKPHPDHPLRVGHRHADRLDHGGSAHQECIDEPDIIQNSSHRLAPAFLAHGAIIRAVVAGATKNPTPEGVGQGVAAMLLD
jgi:hypothetical protein